MSLFAVNRVITPRNIQNSIHVCPSASFPGQFLGVGCNCVGNGGCRMRSTHLRGQIILVGFINISSHGTTRLLIGGSLRIPHRSLMPLGGNRRCVCSVLSSTMCSLRNRRLKGLASMLHANDGSICIIATSSNGRALLTTVPSIVGSISRNRGGVIISPPR